MSRAGLVLVVWAACLAGAAGGPMPFYAKHETWQETLRASREALVHREAAAEQAAEQARKTDPGLKAFKPFAAELKLDGEVHRLRLGVRGLRTLCLQTKHLRRSQSGRGTLCFGSPTLVGADGKATPLVPRGPLLAAVFGDRHIRTERDRRWTEAKLDAAKAPAKADTGDELEDLLLELDEDEADQKDVPRFVTGFMLGRDTEAVFRLDGKYVRFDAWVCLLPTENALSDVVAVTATWRSDQQVKEQMQANRQALWERVAREFGAPALRREWQLERRERIWDEDWKPGDVAELALRYARRSDVSVRKQATTLAAEARTPDDLAAVRTLFHLKHATARVAFARKTLEFVQRTAPRPKLAAELADLEQALGKAIEHPETVRRNLYAEACQLRRRIILSHPLLDFDRLLINKRTCHIPGHMCDQYLGRHQRPGPGLAVLDSWKDNPKETLLLEGKLPAGTVMHPDLSFDAKRILFGFCDTTVRDGKHKRFWVYEIGVDGTGLRQLTGTPTDPRERWGGRQTVLIEDWDPCYLPDGGFAFISTRSQAYGRCHGSRYVPAYLLYRADGDGSNIRQLSFGEANEWDPAVLNDGRIIYTRWDYINRHDTNYQSLWVMRPDGTGTAHFYGNYSVGPCMIAEARAIPGSRKVIATATDHHGYTSGSIIVIDPYKGQDEGEPLTAVTPEFGFPERGAPKGTTFTPRPLPEDEPNSGGMRGGRRAATPLALSEDLFLIACASGAHFGIYLVDTLGGRELIYQDPDTSCFAPIPIKAQPVPPAYRSALPVALTSKTGKFYVQDVYQCTQPLERGSIKRLRINRIHGQPTRSKPRLSLANNEILKSILGTVPVNDDGSAAFTAPAGVPLQLQALDENGMAVMTMRSCVYLQPGETASCVGCHEPRSASPPPRPIPPTVVFHKPTPPAGPSYPGAFSFVRTVQPVLDRYCIGCHGLDKKEGGVCLLGTRTTYNQAHDALTSRGLVVIAYRNRETGVSKPKDYFAHAGKLVKVLREKHKDRVKLDPQSFECIVNWLDLNAQFYGDYSFNRAESRRPNAQGEKALRKHIEEAFGEKLAGQPFEALVNVALPTESRILNAPLAVDAGGWGQIRSNGWKGASDPGYKKMLELVEGAITPLQRHDIAGTCGGGKRCNCGNCWVRLLNEQEKGANYHADASTPAGR